MAEVRSHQDVPGPISTDRVDVEQAFMAIPDDENQAIHDARRTYVITVVSAVLFVAASLVVLFT